jgi:cysteinyl-tRNA synthetase
MDPFAALGAAAAIAQFIQQSISLVKSARQIYQSAFGETAENEQLGSVIRELKNLSGRMVSKKPRHEQSDAEKSLGNVASECQILSEKILGLLEKMKVKDPKSIRQSAVAALKSAWNDKEKKELVEQADKCRDMMHTQLTLILGLVNPL